MLTMTEGRDHSPQIARGRALRTLAARHPEEFEQLYQAERERIGLPALRLGKSGGPSDPADFARRWNRRDPVAAMAGRYGCSLTSIYRWADRLGLEPRPGVRKRKVASA